ncbi:helix-turn-helix domain-containing protein [Micromonospora sp. LOL_024]|uniref:helix-turn-helix domain-containing protein n=1 Tax=Micromonospora sp. LOL_024 TaxID=3345412 RepID=UPI003A89F910
MTEGRLAAQIANALRREREGQQLTQRALADLAGVSQGTLANLEKGHRVPSLALVERVLAALDRQLAVTVEPLDAHLAAHLKHWRPVHCRNESRSCGWTACSPRSATCRTC